MNSKERVLKSILHKQTDRVPLDYWSRRDVTSRLILFLGLNSKEELFQRLGIDFRKIKINESHANFEKKTTGMLKGSSESSGRRYIIYEDGRFEDEWGVVRRIGSNGLYDEWISGPFVNNTDINYFHWPKLDIYESVEAIHKRLLTYENKYALIGYLDLPFKNCWLMRGLENFLCDMLINPVFAKKLLQQVATYQKEKGLRLIRAGVDIIGIYGDLGMQDRLLVEPRSWRAIEKPVLAEMIDSFKNENPDVLIFLHSDGNIFKLIPDFIEIGVDILNPIQPECMDPMKVKQKFGDKITMHGTISLQKTLPYGSVDDVIREVKERIKTCGQNGGLVIGPSNLFQNDIPLKNIIAMYDAVLNNI